jgi:hypothetical protein
LRTDELQNIITLSTGAQTRKICQHYNVKHWGPTRGSVVSIIISSTRTSERGSVVNMFLDLAHTQETVIYISNEKARMHLFLESLQSGYV